MAGRRDVVLVVVVEGGEGGGSVVAEWKKGNAERDWGKVG